MTELAPLHGLLHERATPAYEAAYEHAWQRDTETWRAALAAVDAWLAGEQPARPRAAAPRWFLPMARRRLAEASTSAWQGASFGEVRRLERLGLLTLDPDDPYVLALVCAAPGADALRADPELVERALWRVFEVEGGGEVSLTNVDRFTRGEPWRTAFVTLVADGTLPRERVLRSCLAALGRDFAAYRAGWYGRLYDALAPTPEEQAAHQDLLRALLRSAVPATVTLAVRRLRALGRAGLLDDAATVPALRPALLARAKGTAVDALRLLGEAAARGHAVVDVAAAALDNPNADVQRAAVTVLTDLGARDVAVARVAVLEPSVAASLGVSPAAPEPAAAPAPSAAAVRGVRPVAGDLIERLAALIEDASDGAEVEAVLAGLAALRDPDVLRPVRSRAATVLRRGPRDGVTFGWLRGHLARLVLLALGEPADPVPVEAGTEFLVARLGEVAHALTTGTPFPMLATPDDGWWVRPATLLGRLDGDARHHDLVAALLRLAPDGRVPAGDGPVAYALGGPPPRSPEAVREQPALWVAAARARDPLGTDGLLAAAGLDGAGRARPLSGAVDRWTVRLAGAVDDAPVDQPTAAPPRPALWENELEDWVGWLAMTWPHDTEHVLAQTASAVLVAAGSTVVRHDAGRVLDVLAVHPGRRGPLAYATLAAGLAASRADQVRAVDAVLAGPLDPAALAQAMAGLAAHCPPARWARGLADVAAGGGGAFVVDVLAALLPTLPRDTRGLAALLATYREETLRHGVRPAPALRDWLAAFGGSSKTATLAKALLAEC